MRKENKVNRGNTQTRGTEDTSSRENLRTNTLGKGGGHRHSGKNRTGSEETWE